jgi:hypothetical protein
VGAGSVASDAFEGGGDVSIVPYGAGAISDSFNPMTQPLLTGDLDLFSQFRSNIANVLPSSTNDGAEEEVGYSCLQQIDMVDPGMPKTVNITVPAGPKEGELLTVVDTSVAGVGAGAGPGNEINIFPLGADTINGVAGPYVINTQNGSVSLRCDGGTNWVVVDPGSSSAHLEAPPEKWFQDNVAASQADVDLGTKVSVTFSDIKAIRAGSIVGLSTRFTETLTDATVDSAIVTVTINGVEGTLAVSQSSGVNPDGGEVTQQPGVDSYAKGDLIGISITTLASFTPVTTDLEAWLEVVPD